MNGKKLLWLRVHYLADDCEMQGQNIGPHEDGSCTALSTGLRCPQLPLPWQVFPNEVDLFAAS